MDGLTHSLVGLAAAKTGLDRWSPYTAAVCVVAANAPDADVVTAIGGRWAALHYHRGITHSIVGVIALGILIPSIVCVTDRVYARVRNSSPRARYAGLLVASLIASATHPMMDWTNNYGIRPLLPWDGRWFYGDFVFIIDPFIWLFLGAAVFLVTSKTSRQVIVWGIIGGASTLFIFGASARAVRGGGSLAPAQVIWAIGLMILIFARWKKVNMKVGTWLPAAGLVVLLFYWCGLAWQHHLAYQRTVEMAQQIVGQRGERLVRAAAMPIAANPFVWLAVVESDSATYRFTVSSIGARRDPSSPERFEKPSGREQQLVEIGKQDPRARILMEFARFPAERVSDPNCFSQTLVHFADLRYTEPQGPARGNFALDVPVECDKR